MLYHKCDIIKNVEVRSDENRHQSLLVSKEIDDLQSGKEVGYGYTTLHKSFNKQQTSATSLNLRDLDALAQASQQSMWEVLRELEESYLSDDD